MRTRILAAILVCAVCTAAIPHALAEGFLTSVGSGADEIPVVVVRGTPYEMGRAQGTLLRREIQQFMPQFLQLCHRADPERYSERNLDSAWKTVAPYTDPRFKDELRGVAEGAQVPLELLQRVHAMPIVSDYACSSIAAWGKATANGHLYQTRNLDWEMRLGAQDYPCIVVYLPTSGLAHVNVTFAGFIGCNTGMNAEGIALAEMGDSPGRDYPFDLRGVHFTAMFRQLLYDARSLDEAVDQIRSAKRIKKYHFVVGDGQLPGGVKILAHAPNMVVWTDNDPQDELAPNVLDDVVYQDEGRGAFEPLQRAHGRIDHQTMIDLCRRIPIKGSNVLDVVYDATALEMWVAYAEKLDEAYRRPFVHFRLRDYLDFDRGFAQAEQKVAAPN